MPLIRKAAKIDVEHARETQFLRLSLELVVARRIARDPNGHTVARATKIINV